MSDDQLTPLPDSFIALYAGPRGRLTEPAAQVRARYDLCEDLANHLQPTAQAALHDDGVAEEDVLLRLHGALVHPDAGLALGEAGWVVTRLAELLRWPCPALGTPV